MNRNNDYQERCQTCGEHYWKKITTFKIVIFSFKNVNIKYKEWEPKKVVLRYKKYVAVQYIFFYSKKEQIENDFIL